VKVGLVTTRYATALFELARDKGAIAAVTADVERLPRECANGELFDARVPESEKRKRIEAIASKSSPLFSNFLHLIFEKRRLAILRELPDAFRRCALADRGAVEGIVESPRPLGQGELAELQITVKSVLGKDVILEQRANPELIAGVRVFVDNRLIDQSALGRLEGLERRLRTARV
jgi:F-type H+-transporting ATPase subunit delta